MKETLSTDTREAAKVVSEDEDTEVSEEASTCRNGLFSKGSLYKRVAYPLLNDCYLFRQQEQRKVVLFIPRGQSWKFEKKSTRYSRTNSVYSSHRKQWKKFLKTSTSAQIINNKQSLKSCGKNQNIGNKRHSRKFVHTPSTSGTNHYCL